MLDALLQGLKQAVNRLLQVFELQRKEQLPDPSRALILFAYAAKDIGDDENRARQVVEELMTTCLRECRCAQFRALFKCTNGRYELEALWRFRLSPEGSRLAEKIGGRLRKMAWRKKKFLAFMPEALLELAKHIEAFEE